MSNQEINQRISYFLQKELKRRGKSEVSAVEAAEWLDSVGIFKDCMHRPGKRLRDKLREGKIVGQRQEPNKRWYIDKIDKEELL